MTWMDALHRWLKGAAASRPVEPPPPPPPRTLDMAQAITVAKTIWAEARGEGPQGMQAVANVIVNRTKNPGWWSRHADEIPDDTFAAVCRDPFQFSCWNADDPNRALIDRVTVEDPQYRVALSIASDAVAGTLGDLTNGCDHYHTVSTLPRWAARRSPDFALGRHLFYRIGRKG